MKSRLKIWSWCLFEIAVFEEAILKIYFLREQFWKCVFTANNLQNVFFDEAFLKKVFFEMHFLTEHSRKGFWKIKKETWKKNEIKFFKKMKKKIILKIL